MLDPKLLLIDEPSIGLSPLMVQEIFSLLRRLRDSGVTVLMIEQNARAYAWKPPATQGRISVNSGVKLRGNY